MQQPIKIGYLYSFNAYPPKGGGHRHAFELTQGFIRNGHTVYVLGDGTMPNAININIEDVDTFIQSIELLYVRIDGVELANRPGVIETLQKAKGLPQVWEINAPADERLAFSWLGGKQSEHENLFIRLKRKIHAARQLRAIIREKKQLRHYARSVDAAICLTKATDQYTQQELSIEKTKIIPMAGPIFDYEKITSTRALEKRHSSLKVLYSGSADFPWLGLRYLTETITLANQQSITDIEFHFVIPKVTEYIPSGSLVKIHENLSFDDIITITMQCDVGIALYPEYTWVARGLHNSPTKIFEYMACGCPAISSNHGQMKEIITHGYDGYLTNNDPQEILNHLIALKQSPEKIQEMGHRAWQKIQQTYNWDNVVDQTLATFDSVLANQR